MNPIERRGTIKYIDETDDRVIIERQSGPAKMDYGDEKEILTPRILSVVGTLKIRIGLIFKKSFSLLLTS